MKANLVDIQVQLHHSTPMAYKVSLDGDVSNAVWIPKSICELHEEDLVYTLTCTEQVAIDKRLV